MYCIANPGQPKATPAAVLGIVLAVLLGTSAVAQTTGAFVLRNGVVIAPDSGMVYLMSPGGGIDAVSLAFGTVQWHSDDAARPISASAAGILAQAETPATGSLQLALLDTSGRLLQSATVALPAGVEAPVDDGLSHRFLIRGAEDDDGRFQVEWQSTFLPPRGALILDGASDPVVQTGAFAFDPVSGEVAAAGSPAAPLSGSSIEVPESQRLALPGRQFLSVDRRHRMASVPGIGSAADTYVWTLYDSVGDRLGSLSRRTSYTPFHVSGDLVVFETRPGAWMQGARMVEEPLSLRAVSLPNGAEQWSFAVRDTEYRGPFPP